MRYQATQHDGPATLMEKAGNVAAALAVAIAVLTLLFPNAMAALLAGALGGLAAKLAVFAMVVKP